MHIGLGVSYTQQPTYQTRKTAAGSRTACLVVRRLAFASVALTGFDPSPFNSIVVMEGGVAKRGLSGWKGRYAVSGWELDMTICSCGKLAGSQM